MSDGERHAWDPPPAGQKHGHRCGSGRSLIVGTLIAVGLLLGLVGCADEPIVFTEVKRPNERVTRAEWAAFVRIVEGLPDPKLRQFPSVFAPLPQWQDARTLPVSELASEERRQIKDAWEVERVAAEFPHKKIFSKLLRRERMTPEQFAGLVLTLGAAMSRAELSEEFAFNDLIRRGQDAIAQLQRDHRLFSSLTIESRHHVLDQAVWLHRVDRAERLAEVPLENVALVREQSDWLRSVMPGRFSQPPFADVVDLLEERGLPFVELPETGTDDRLRWSRKEAIVGR